MYSQCQLADASPFCLCLHIQVFPPFRLIPRKVTLIIGAMMQVGATVGLHRPSFSVSISPLRDGEDSPAWQVLMRATVSHFSDHL